MSKKAIAGYVVLDEGRSVVRYVLADGRAQYWPKHPHSIVPISIFKSITAAQRVKRNLRNGYVKQAYQFNPEEDADQKRCFDLWSKRARELRISAVIFDEGRA